MHLRQLRKRQNCIWRATVFERIRREFGYVYHRTLVFIPSMPIGLEPEALLDGQDLEKSRHSSS
jgi:hypothetical protein